MGRMTKEEKESGVITAAIFAIVMLLLFVLKISPDKKEEEKKEEIVVQVLDEGGGGGGGVALNFGSSGDGAKYQSDVSAPSVPDQSSMPTEEAVGSSDEKAEAVVNTNPVKNRDPKMQNPRPQSDNKPKKPTNAALDNMLSGGDAGGGGNGLSNGNYGQGGQGGGTGTGNGTGNGSGNGPGSGSGSGGGSGGGIGMGIGGGLKGRKVVLKPEPDGCNEAGKVVIEVIVDQTGKVTKANNTRGTAASACLIQQARAAALKTKFAPNDKAGLQTGTITYNFTLTD